VSHPGLHPCILGDAGIAGKHPNANARVLLVSLGLVTQV
jgi:hypothetical protein